MQFRQGSQLSAHKRIHAAIRKFSMKNDQDPVFSKRFHSFNFLVNFKDTNEEIDEISNVNAEDEEFSLPMLGYNQEFSSLPTSFLHQFSQEK